METTNTTTPLLRPFPPHPMPIPIGAGDLDTRPLHFAARTSFDEDLFSSVDPSFDVDGAAARVVAAYDRNDDGAIDVSLTSNETLKYAGGATSVGKLASVADERGNGDGQATVEEIAAVIAGFDGTAGILGARIGADGRLDANERRRFLAEYGEVPAVWTGIKAVPFGSPSLVRPHLEGSSYAAARD